MSNTAERPKQIRNPALAKEVADALYRKLFNHKGRCPPCVEYRRDRSIKPLSGRGRCFNHEVYAGGGFK